MTSVCVVPAFCRSKLLLLTLLGASNCFHANAAFIGQYDPNNFTLSNSPFTDGSVSAAAGGASITITGGNSGSGLPGFTDFVIAAAASGTVSYNYLYSTLDPDPSFDQPGSLVGGVFTPYTIIQGSISFAVAANQMFGFRVETLDNLGEPGILTISNFDVSSGGSGVPEPAFPVLIFAAIVLAGLRKQRVLSFSKIRRSMSLWSLIAVLALSVGRGAFAQNQFLYTGSSITGQLTKTAVVNARLAAMADRSSARAIGPEIKQFSVRFPHPPVTSPPFLRDNNPPPMISSPVAGTTAFGFNALSNFDQRNANNGNQYNVEPPNQSVAAANGFVLQGVNNAIQIYNTAGAPQLLAVLSTNQLFGVSPAIDRATGINGVFPTDMRVFYDHSIDRWFVIQRAQDYDIFGDPLNQSHLYIAASQTNDPTGFYNIYTLNTTNTGHPGCPCIADYPQIGADQHGLHISINEYDPNSIQFIDVRILSISKTALASGATAPATFDIYVNSATGYEMTVHPATTPPGATYYLASGGAEFFMSTHARFSSDSSVALWALTNTASLTTSNPNLTLIQSVVPALPYSYPNVANQRSGPLPYGSSLFPPRSLAGIDAGDSRIQSLVYVGGRLYAAFATQAVDENGRTVTGSAYAFFSPTLRAGILAATAIRRGYVLVRNNHLLRPAIAVNAQGRGAMVFTLVGTDYYPSAAFIPIDLSSIGSSVQIAGAGAGPEDGFTGYQSFPPIARWGDYSTAVAAADGSIWMTAEYIPNSPRTAVANWGSFIIQYRPQ